MAETGDEEPNVITNDIGEKVDGSMDNDDEQLDTKDKAKEDCTLNKNETDESKNLTLKEDEAAGQDSQSNEHDDNAALASTESQSPTGLHASDTADQTLNEEKPIQARISNEQLTTSSVSDGKSVSQDDFTPNENPKEPPSELAPNSVDDLQTQAKAQEPLEPVQESTSGACDQEKIETELKVSECDSHEPGTQVSQEVSDQHSQKTSARDDEEVQSPASPDAEHTLPRKNTNDLKEEVLVSQNGARNNEKNNDVREFQKDEGDIQTTSNSKGPEKISESKPRAREVGAAKEKRRSTESKTSSLNIAGRRSPKSKADRSARPEVKANGSKTNAHQDSPSRQHDAIALAARRSSGAGVSHAEAPRHTVAVASRVADLDRLARAARRNSLPLDRKAVHAAQLAMRDAKLGVPHSAEASAAAKDTRKRQKRTKTEIQVSHPAYNTVDRPLEPPQRARPRALSSESPASPVQETSSPPPQLTLDAASKSKSSTRGSPQSSPDRRSRRAASPHSPNSPANDHFSPGRGGRKQHAVRGEEKPRWRSPMSPQSPVSPVSGHQERTRSPPGLANAESLDVADPVELKRLIVEEVKRTVRTQMARESRKDFEDKERKEKEHQVAEARKQAIAERQTQALQKLRQESDYLRKRNKDQEREIRRLQSVNTGLTRDIKVIVEEERRMAAIAIAEARNDLKRQLQHLMQEHNAQVEAMQNKIRHLELTQNPRHVQHQHTHQKHQYSELAEEKQHHSGEGLRNVGQDKRRARLLHLVDRAIASVEEIEVAPASGHAGSLSPLSRKMKR